MNTNANDVKIRDNRIMMFRHFAVIGGFNDLDDRQPLVPRGYAAKRGAHGRRGHYLAESVVQLSAAIISITTSLNGPTSTAAEPASWQPVLLWWSDDQSNNIFFASNVAASFKFLVIKPYGVGHFIHGFSVMGNVFRSINGYIDRVEKVDTTFADLDFSRMRMVNFSGNTFHGVSQEVYNPAFLEHTQGTAASTWTADTEPFLPFKGRARYVDSVCTDGVLQNSSNGSEYIAPSVATGQGTNKRDIKLTWGKSVKGTVRFIVRMDNPL